MNPRILLLSIGMAVLGLGCSINMVEVTDDFKLQGSKRKYVVQAFLRTDADTVPVYVSESLPLSYNKWIPSRRMGFGQENSPLEHAVVTVEDLTAGKRLVLGFSGAWGSYVLPTAQLPIAVGHRYAVRGEGGETTAVMGECLGLAVNRPQVSYRASSKGQIVTIDVPATPRRYFWISLGVDSISTARGLGDVKLLSSEHSVDGHLIYNSNAMGEGGISFGEDPNKCLMVCEVDEHTYRYLQDEYRLEAQGGNPFTMPIVGYTNVRDGLGYVGSGYVVVDEKLKGEGNSGD